MSSRSHSPDLLALILGLAALRLFATRPQVASEIADPRSTAEVAVRPRPRSSCGWPRFTRNVQPASCNPAGGYGAPRGRHLAFDAQARS